MPIRDTTITRLGVNFFLRVAEIDLDEQKANDVIPNQSYVLSESKLYWRIDGMGDKNLLFLHAQLAVLAMSQFYSAQTGDPLPRVEVHISDGFYLEGIALFVTRKGPFHEDSNLPAIISNTSDTSVL